MASKELSSALAAETRLLDSHAVSMTFFGRCFLNQLLLGFYIRKKPTGNKGTIGFLKGQLQTIAKLQTEYCSERFCRSIKITKLLEIVGKLLGKDRLLRNSQVFYLPPQLHHSSVHFSDMNASSHGNI